MEQLYMCDKKTPKSERYSLEVICTNCGWSGVAILLKGYRPSSTTECPHCQCMFVLGFGKAPEFDE
jgi:hypothetical protein